MATTRQAVEFDEIINADRQRRKNEALANEIFGRSRRVNDPGKNANRKAGQSPSLASRIGIAKRSSSSTNIKPYKSSPSNPIQPPSRPTSAAAQIARTSKIASAVNSTHQANILTSTQPRTSLPGSGLSIRGTAGPFVVHASNFAPGTTAADIESALQQVATDSNGGNGMSSCRIMSNNPTVIAEMVFAEKHIADTVITTFNNQKADGRILHVFLKSSGPAALSPRKKIEPPVVPEPPSAPPSRELFDQANDAVDSEDVDMISEPTYNNARQEADQGRREKEARRAEPDIQDGRYGFGSRDERNETEAPQQPLQTQNDVRDARSDDRSHDNRRDNGRERRYDDTGYQRRDEVAYRRDDRSDQYRRGGRTSHYGNNVGRGYGNGDRYGRMYSDEMMTDRPSGPRGGYRGYR